tara:strand:- start:115 stop:975 length:861 start_codon:yes stop_codon:yes gene_type:complete
MKIHKIRSSLSNYISIILFNKRLPISYCLFNYFFNKLIVNKNNLNNILKAFNEDGYTKIDKIFSDEVDIINENKIVKEKFPNRVVYDLPQDIKLELIKKLNNKLDGLLNDLKKYYYSDVNIVDTSIWTNYKPKEVSPDKEYFSERFHCDGYISNYIKIHINLMDVDETCGPLNIISKKINKKFIKDFNYKNRNYYNNKNNYDYIYSNVGKKGEAILFDSTNCFHRATIPENHRSMMQLILFVSPFQKTRKMNNLSNLDYVNFAKPVGITNVLSLFAKYFKNKLSFN